MTPQYETLLKQLFVTWDITNRLVSLSLMGTDVVHMPFPNASRPSDEQL